MMQPINSAYDPRCYRLAQAAVQAVLNEARACDIVFLSSLCLPRLIESGGKRCEPPQGATDVFARSGAELEGIRRAAIGAPRWIRPFIDAGPKMPFEIPKSILRAHLFRGVDWFNRKNADCPDGLRELSLDQERSSAPVVDAIRKLAKVHPGMSVWDSLPALCDATHFNALREGRPRYFDGDHVSPYGNLALLPRFQRAIYASAGP